MDTVKVTAEYGIVVRRKALSEKIISYSMVLEAMETEAPLDSNDDLISFGPSFGGEALDSFIKRLQILGLEYVDDFFSITFDMPPWCDLRVGIGPGD